MGCGTCGGGDKSASASAAARDASGNDLDEWVFVSNNGDISHHPTQLAARAAMARAGNRGLVRKK